MSLFTAQWNCLNFPSHSACQVAAAAVAPWICNLLGWPVQTIAFRFRLGVIITRISKLLFPFLGRVEDFDTLSYCMFLVQLFIRLFQLLLLNKIKLIIYFANLNNAWWETSGEADSPLRNGIRHNLQLYLVSLHLSRRKFSLSLLRLLFFNSSTLRSNRWRKWASKWVSKAKDWIFLIYIYIYPGSFQKIEETNRFKLNPSGNLKNTPWCVSERVCTYK